MELKGKKVLFIGDSITEGAGASSYDKCYVSRFADVTGANVVNRGIGGTGYVNANERGGKFADRIDEYDEDADIVVIFGGTNDFTSRSAELGDIDDNSLYTICGCINNFFRMIVERFPTATVVSVIPTRRSNDRIPSYQNGCMLDDVNNAIRHVCEHYSIPTIDLFYSGTVCPGIEAHRINFTVDGLHPNDVWYDRIANRIAQTLYSL